MNSFVASFILFASLLCTVTAKFKGLDEHNIAVYWGQNSLGTATNGTFNEKNLTKYCDNDDVGIVLLSFMNVFPGTDDVPTLTFKDYEYSAKYPYELKGLESEIKYCQNKDVLVMLSLGGEGDGYGFKNDTEGAAFAAHLWSLFGPKNESLYNVTRPFGDDILIDGFDLDAENDNSTGYVDLLYNLKSYINATSSNKTFYLSAAPQCPTYDNILSDVVAENYLDFLFIQFYNNHKNCDANSDNFNWYTWVEKAKQNTKNSNIKLFMGIPGGEKAASTGYFSNSTSLGEKVYKAKQNETYFGGISIYDAGFAFNNTDATDDNYLNIVNAALNYTPPSTSSSSSSSGSSSSSSGSSSSSSSASSTATKNAGSKVQFSLLSGLAFFVLNILV